MIVTEGNKLHFYCQNLCDNNEEKDMCEESVDDCPICKEQCFECMAEVGEELKNLIEILNFGFDVQKKEVEIMPIIRDYNNREIIWLANGLRQVGFKVWIEKVKNDPAWFIAIHVSKTRQ